MARGEERVKERTGWIGDASKVLGVTAVALVAAAVSAPPLSAQLAWDAPFMVHPHAPAGWAIFLADPHPGDEVAVVGSWRTPAHPFGIGLRAGLGEDASGSVSFFTGADVSGSLVTWSEDAPVDVVWVAGAGLGIADEVLLSLPLGAVAGWSFDADGTAFRPWVGPRVVLDVWSGAGDRMSLDLVLDGGVDVAVSGWVIRVGASVLDREALAVGLSLPLGRSPAR